MVDLHAHILPGIDDGAKDLDEALEMCRIAARDAITTIVATPHTGNETYYNDRETILAAVKALQAHLTEQEIPLRIVAGSDAHVNHDLSTLIRSGIITTINDNHRYVMAEFPNDIIPPAYLDWLFEAKLRGITPIFTHPERHGAIQRDISPVAQWVEKGGLVQITAMSLTGEFGREARKCAEELLRRRLVHVMASDAHSVNGRPPVLSKAVVAAIQVVDFPYIHRLVTEFPASIVAGRPFDIPQPQPAKGRQFSVFLGRR
jgi:protein-tyrosine phosphatase